MLPTEALKKIETESAKVVDSEAHILFTDLRFTSPKDTGFFKSQWKIKKRGFAVWRISNNADYADILARGRRVFGGKVTGSKQWQNGLSPMLQKTDKQIERRLDAIRY